MICSAFISIPKNSIFCSV